MNAACGESAGERLDAAETRDRNWYAIHVRSRHEFVTSDELRKKGVNAFLPTATRISQWKDRKKRIVCALFPGYLFVHIGPHPEEFMQVIKSRGTVAFVSLEPGHPTPVPPEEIQTLQILLQSGRDVDLYPHLTPGARVRVKRGPLSGAEGVLASREDRHLFLVNIEILGRSVGLPIYAEDVERAW